MKFNQSSIPTNYSQNLKTISFDWDPNDTDKIFSVMFAAMSDFLGIVKSKDTKTALVMDDLKGNFIIAGIVTYHENEEEKDMAGNFSYVITTDPKDIEDCKVFKMSDPQFIRIVASTSHNLFAMHFQKGEFILPMFEKACKTLLNWMDVNADQKEEKSVELDGYFVATVAVEDGEKIYSIVPDGAMKRLIKDDAALEQDVA